MTTYLYDATLIYYLLTNLYNSSNPIIDTIFNIHIPILTVTISNLCVINYLLLIYQLILTNLHTERNYFITIHLLKPN